jgi:hypothetical protein
VNWGAVLESAAWTVAGLIVLSMIINLIANAVVKARKAGAFRAELAAPELSGYGGTIHVALDSEDELIKFLQRYAQDIIRWSESPDRAKR